MIALGKYVLIKDIEEKDKKTKSGIIIAQSKKFTDTDGNIRYRKGQIISVGNKVKDDWAVLREGDNVLYNRADAHEIETGEGVYLVDCAGIQVKL